MPDEATVPAKNPLGGTSAWMDNQLGWEAWKNQAAFGRHGKRQGVSPEPIWKLNGSFHRPNPQVPGRSTAETLADSSSVQGDA